MEQGIKSLMMSLICFLSYGKWNFKTAYNAIYQGQNKSNTFKSIVQQAFGDEFPGDTDSFSFVTLTDLNRMADCLNLNPGDWFADIACGRGGRGMWLARHTHANVLGVDISKEAIDSAIRRISEFGLESRVRFNTGSFYDTGLDTESCHGAVSIDALWVAPDRNRTFMEISRILKPGASFVFTTWDGNIPFMPDDHQKSLTDSGIDIELYEETRGWKERQLAVYDGILNAKDLLIKEMGKPLALPIIKEAKSTPPILDKSKRIFVAARKK